MSLLVTVTLPVLDLMKRYANGISLGSLVEIILFMVLITREGHSGINYIQVIKAAILGSVLATMLLCLGLCFVVGGLVRHESTFSEAVSEAGSGLLLTA